MEKRTLSVIAGIAAMAALLVWLPATLITLGLSFVFDLSDDRDFYVVGFFVFYLMAAFCGSFFGLTHDEKKATAPKSKR